MPAMPTVRNNPELLEAAAAEAPTSAAAWTLVEESTLPREAAMLAVGKGAAVLDEGFVRSLLMITKWFPRWQENPAVRPYDGICLRWWRQTLLTDTDGRTARVSGHGLRWLAENGHVPENSPDLAALEAFVLQGKSSMMREPRAEAAWVLASASAVGVWNIDRLSDWWAHQHVAAWGDKAGPLVLQHASLVHIGVFLGQINPDYNSGSLAILVDRDDVRLHPVLRKALVDLLSGSTLSAQAGLMRSMTRTLGDNQSDFETIVKPYMERPNPGHTLLAQVLEEFPEVGTKLGRTRLTELVNTSPEAACRAQAALALSKLDLSPGQERAPVPVR